MGGLQLDSFEGATADRQGHAALVPGNPEASAVYERITSDQKARRMPPAYSNHNLTNEQIALLKRWIEEGGKYNKHWAFVPPVRPAVPQVADSKWVKQPIDAFVLQRLQTERLRPNPAADPGAWLRRVSLDLTGLPPSPAESDSFSKEVKKRGESAYESAVDRLLASAAYGERMAMDWLDVARYADTHGFNNDSERSMWRWRDWVIDSFNSNKPYNRFLTEQLAGDLLPNPTLDQRIATGFGRNHVINSEGGIIDEEYRVEYVSDRVRTLGMAWMGLTLECAHCHDHKFDPITQRDHYRFFAFFNSIPEMGEDGRVANAVPIMPAPTAEQQKKIQVLQSAIANVSHRVEARERSWTWNGRSLSSGGGLPPGGTTLCAPDAGSMASASCVAGSMATQKITISKKEPLTFSVWVHPAESDRDVALLSALDYSENMAAASYGSGAEFRLSSGELEFRFSQRYPAYSLRIRSEGAAISTGQWRNVAFVYEGAAGHEAGLVPSSAVRIFADGHELPTVVLNDDLPMPDSNADKPSTFRIGWDNNAHSARYAGKLGEISFWNRALNTVEIGSLFESRALPFASARQLAHEGTEVERNWLREADLKATDPNFAKDASELRRLRGELLAVKRSAPTVMVMQEMSVPRETHILTRGSYDVPGEKVEPGVPEGLLGAWPAGAPKNRLGLAQWLTKPDNPLTSRVVVNRFWQQLFGTGIVKTSDNFGMQGEWPSHPELLDWLAREFVDSGWNVKALMRRLVLSATYRQNSSASKELVARDPENRLLARGPRFRLPAEVIRDQALQISGLLKPRVGGPSVYPYQPPDLYKGIVVAANYPGTKYVQSKGDDLYRRSMYTFWKRTVPHPTMNVLDAPDREVCIVKRSITNTPLQALALLNDPIFVEAARKLAERSIKEGGAAPRLRLIFAFRLATGRAPDDREMGILEKSLDQMLAAYAADEKGARALVAIGESISDASIPIPELAAYTAVVNIILNMDEVITKG